jgi:aspartate-semialdehyde dehydrogenase
MKTLNVAVVGATGAVGQTMLKVLEECSFPVATLLPLASARSKGQNLVFRGETTAIEEACPEAFSDIDLAFFSAGTDTSLSLAPEAVKRGAVVVDNSNAFRMNPDVPLVVPEVNPEALRTHQGIVANPNCSTIQMVMVLKPLHDRARIKRVVVSTYQAVSGTGQEAIAELRTQSSQVLLGQPVKPEIYPYQIAFNVLPHIDVFDETGYTLEEWKMVRETAKIMSDETIAITATAVRVPVMYGHSEAINIETEKKLLPEEARAILAQAPGVVVVDDPRENKYPLPTQAAGRNEVFVGRIREDFSTRNGLNLWVVADNVRKGAAYNAVQIAERLLTDGLL